jgi:hypothetical protein
VLLELIGQALSDGKTSRLYKRLVFDDRIATRVQASQNGREINSQFQIYAFAQPGAGLDKVEAWHRSRGAPEAPHSGAGNLACSRLSAGWTLWKAGPQPG